MGGRGDGDVCVGREITYPVGEMVCVRGERDYGPVVNKRTTIFSPLLPPENTAQLPATRNPEFRA